MNKNIKALLIIGGIVLAVLIIVPLIFGIISGWDGYGYGMMGMMGGFGWMWMMPVFWVVIIGLIVWAITSASRHSESDGSGPTTTSSALEILKKRYAQGEISKQEYQEKKGDIV